MRTRSLLFAQGDSVRKLAGVQGCGADALILDLDGSVVPVREDAACACRKPFGGRRCARLALFVRIDSQLRAARRTLAAVGEA